MNKNNIRKKAIALTFALLGLLGLALGVSVCSFILSLNRDDKLLSVLSYFCLLLFILFLVALMFVYLRYSDVLKKKKGKKENEE